MTMLAGICLVLGRQRNRGDKEGGEKRGENKSSYAGKQAGRAGAQAEAGVADVINQQTKHKCFKACYVEGCARASEI